MFKRSEKKIKAVFKMQFQATQVPQMKAKSLMISLVPVDVGKPTVRLAKAPILEGSCTWANPVYETVKLVKETKTGRIREKFYYVVVSTGSSKSGFLGEVSIDFADLAEAYKPVSLTLPLQTSKSGAILHVTLQNMQGVADSRYDQDEESLVSDPNLDRGSDDLSEVASPHDGHNGSFEDTESDNNDCERKSTFGSLTDEMKVLERRTELSELEVQSLRKQIIKETKRGQQLSEHIVCLKEERDALKAECEQLKSSLTCKNEGRVLSHTAKETQISSASLEKIKQELDREKQLNRKLKLHVQKTEDSNSEFVLAMRDLSKKLEQKNTEISRLSSKMKALHNGSDSVMASPRTKMDQNGDDAEMLKQKIESLYSEIEAHKQEKVEIQMQVDRLTLDFDSLEAENKGIHSKLEQTETEKMDLELIYTESIATEKKLKLHIASLEADVNRQSLQYSESLDMIDELEFQVESLQKELENQAQTFEEDLEGVTMLKVEQEQRAIRAEETLRKARRSDANANAAEEFKQISAEMSLKMDENEKIAQKAVEEANDLCQKNEVLESMLQKAEEKVQTIRDKHERLLREYSEHKKFTIDDSEQKTTTKESEILQRWKSEKEDLERQLDSVRKEAEKLMLENVSIKSQIDQKKTKEDNLHLQVKKLRLKNNEVKNHLVESELEKEGLKKEISKLKEDLCKKLQELEKAAAKNSATTAVKEKDITFNKVGRNLEKNRTQAVLTEQLEEETMVAEGKNGVAIEVRTHKGKNVNGVEVRVLEDLPVQKGGQSSEFDASSLLNEVASLKERNNNMEEELKEMHDRYSEISLKFAEVEGERQQLVMALRNLKSGKKN